MVLKDDILVPGRQLGTKGTQCGAKSGHPGARKADWNQGHAVWC